MQKQWLIDAHNLMHLIPPVVKEYGNNRVDGIVYLAALVDGICMSHNRRAMLIFDGHPLPIGIKLHKCAIAFGGGKSADEAIINRLKKKSSANKWIVVSDDREVLSLARSQGAETLTCTEFSRNISHIDQNLDTTPEQSHPEKRANVEVSDSEVQEMLELFRKGKP